MFKGHNVRREAVASSWFRQVGESLPAIEVHEGDPGTKVSMDQLFKGKKGVLFAVPGAFTPGCSKVPTATNSASSLLY